MVSRVVILIGIQQNVHADPPTVCQLDLDLSESCFWVWIISQFTALFTYWRCSWLLQLVCLSQQPRVQVLANKSEQNIKQGFKSVWWCLWTVASGSALHVFIWSCLLCVLVPLLHLVLSVVLFLCWTPLIVDFMIKYRFEKIKKGRKMAVYKTGLIPTGKFRDNLFSLWWQNMFFMHEYDLFTFIYCRWWWRYDDVNMHRSLYITKRRSD